MRRFITILTAFSLFLAPLSPVLAAPQFGGLNLAMRTTTQPSPAEQPGIPNQQAPTQQAPAQQPGSPAPTGAQPPATEGGLLLGTRRPAEANEQQPPANSAGQEPAGSADSSGAQVAAPTTDTASPSAQPAAVAVETPANPAEAPVSTPPAAQPEPTVASKNASTKTASPPAPALEPEELPESENGETVLEARERKARQRWYPWVALAVIVGAATAVTVISIRASKDERPDALDRASFLRRSPSGMGIRF